jgi:hypothetical protein
MHFQTHTYTHAEREREGLFINVRFLSELVGLL